MPPHATHSSDDESPLQDNTETLLLRSKRTERKHKRQAKRERQRNAVVKLTTLPTELILESLKLLQPTDVFNFGLVNHRFHSVVIANANVVGDAIINQRYPLLVQCFPLPKLLSDVNPAVRALLSDEKRQVRLGIHHKPYQHVWPPNSKVLCTCLTCIMTWNNLCLALDFAHWQNHLDSGEPIPIIPRGQSPEWNAKLVQRNAHIVGTALYNSLWHARILERHLESTVRAIRRHAKNKGNKRKHVEMTDEDADVGTDAFLTKPGPLSLEFPFQRDEYYML